MHTKTNTYVHTCVWVYVPVCLCVRMCPSACVCVCVLYVSVYFVLCTCGWMGGRVAFLKMWRVSCTLTARAQGVFAASGGKVGARSSARAPSTTNSAAATSPTQRDDAKAMAPRGGRQARGALPLGL